MPNLNKKTTLWDYIEKRYVDVGAKRWVAYWWTLRNGFKSTYEFDPVADVTVHERIFPSRGLARAFAAKLTIYYGAPMIRQEVFEHRFETCGGWETIESTVEEVV